MKKVLYILSFAISIFLLNRIYAYNAYSVGDSITYNGVDYYVIKNSSASEESVTLLKAEPLTVAEVNQFGGVGTANNHVNMYVTSDTSASYYQTAYNNNGYGGMAYYSSETCGYVNDNYVGSGCTTDYAESEVKYVVDAWKTAKAPAATEARLITYDEYTDLSEIGQVCTGSCYEAVVAKYDWVYNINCYYWTMSPYNDSVSDVFDIYAYGTIGPQGIGYTNQVVRPVIVLSKKIYEQEGEIIDANDMIDKKETSTKVNVSNTFENNYGNWFYSLLYEYYHILYN